MKKVLFLILILCFLVLLIIRFSFTVSRLPIKEGNMKITSVFAHNENIPSIYTCDGQDLAPVLTVSEIPSNTQELVLIVDDPDAPMGTFVHWLVYNLPPNTTKIDNKNLPAEAKQGMTDFGRASWGGPCPPSGTHRYFFKIYAIDKKLNLPVGLTKNELEKSIRGHVIEQAELIGLYKRG